MARIWKCLHEGCETRWDLTGIQSQVISGLLKMEQITWATTDLMMFYIVHLDQDSISDFLFATFEYITIHTKI